MKVIKEDGSKRVLLAVGIEEILLIYSLILRAKENWPKLESWASDNQYRNDYQRLRNIAHTLSPYLGIAKERPPKVYQYVQCPYCPRKLKGDKAVNNHVRDIHQKEKITVAASTPNEINPLEHEQSK